MVYDAAVNQFEIAILFLLAGLFLAVLIVGLVTVIWSALQVRSAAKTLATELRGFQAENAKMHESARSNFAAIRKEMRDALESYSLETKATLESHRTQMGMMIENINGAGLGLAAKGISDATKKLTQIAVALQDLLLAREEVEETGQTADQYAPAGASIYTQTASAGLDAEAMVEEQA
jgi:hypothetical protein